MRFIKRWWWVLPVLLLLIAAGFVLWAYTGPKAMPEAMAALESDELVDVEIEPWLAFTPTRSEPDVGLILYPGGRVDPRAYAPAARAIAEQGYQVVIVPMPLNLAVFGAGRASDVIAAYPEIEDWAIGGHSLGGSMAARFALENPDEIQGLALWASYPASGDDLSGYDLEAFSISGTLDGLATVEEINASRPLLPPATGWMAIEGGNHAQFGWYGEQSGDNPATITREEQQVWIVDATLDLLGWVGE